MESILSALYHGRIFPEEQCAPRSEEYRKMAQANNRREDAFIESLRKMDPSLDKKYREIVDERLDLDTYELTEQFIDGFRLGARIMIDVFHGDFST